jgi:hypothetical protein
MLAWRNMQEDFYITLPPRNKILELLKFKGLKHDFHYSFSLYCVSAQVATPLRDDSFCLYCVSAQVASPLSNGLHSELDKTSFT